MRAGLRSPTTLEARQPVTPKTRERSTSKAVEQDGTSASPADESTVEPQALLWGWTENLNSVVASYLPKHRRVLLLGFGEARHLVKESF